MAEALPRGEAAFPAMSDTGLRGLLRSLKPHQMSCVQGTQTGNQAGSAREACLWEACREQATIRSM